MRYLKNEFYERQPTPVTDLVYFISEVLQLIETHLSMWLQNPLKLLTLTMLEIVSNNKCAL